MSSLFPGAFDGTATELVSALPQRHLRIVYSAFSAAGTRSVPITAQAQSTPRQYLMLGDGSIDMTLAIAQAICANPNGTPITASTETQRANLATGMVTYFTNIPAAADGAYCLAFAVGGLECVDVQEATIVNRRRTTTSAVNPADIVTNVSNSVPIGGFGLVQPGNYPQIYLNGSNQLLKQDGSTTIVYGTDTLIVCSAYGVIFGAINITDITDAPNANDMLTLELYYK